ncbi:hypothetical protein AZE42_09432 [Rhizopogon vesiculosus]|uniref:Transmembrane protein n=1 Tax=Rhizopogon vesiculosus TaxID=180088 RepID=A0A1J8QD45_9AGAM|nr:hypothetical protein AZE42_09432 [Rhizopogon vesiculosus]
MRKFITRFIALTGIYAVVAVAAVPPFPAGVAARQRSGINPPIAPAHGDDGQLSSWHLSAFAHPLTFHPRRSSALINSEGGNNSPAPMGAASQTTYLLTDLHDPPSGIPWTTNTMDGAQSLHLASLDPDSTASASTGFSMITPASRTTSFTPASQTPHPTSGRPSLAPEAQNVRLVLQPAGLAVPTSSTSLINTKTMSPSRSALDLNVTPAGLSPSTTPSNSSVYLAMVVIIAFVSSLIIIGPIALACSGIFTVSSLPIPLEMDTSSSSASSTIAAETNTNSSSSSSTIVVTDARRPAVSSTTAPQTAGH